MATFNVNGFVFKKRKKPSTTATSSSNNDDDASHSVPPQKKKISRQTMSPDLPAYPGTICNPSVRGNHPGGPTSYEQDAERLIRLFQNVVRDEGNTVNKTYAADGPFGFFNALASTACGEFSARARSVLVASAQQMETRRKMNAPALKSLPANEHLRAREAVLGSLIEKFEREKVSWRKADEEARPYARAAAGEEEDGESGPNASTLEEEEAPIVVEEQVELRKTMTDSIKKLVVQVDQIYEALDRSRKNGESLEKQRRALSKVLHETSHYQAGSSSEQVRGLTQTKGQSAAFIRAFTSNGHSSSTFVRGGRMGAGGISKGNSIAQLATGMDENQEAGTTARPVPPAGKPNEHRTAKTPLRDAQQEQVLPRQRSPANVLLRLLTAD
jgi:hypothetical protein